MSVDPFERLGLPAAATADEVRRVRRELAKRAHPDVGGADDVMREINDAAAAALRRIADRSQPAEERRAGDDDGDDSAASSSAHASSGWERSRRDAPSFTVEALPVETFEALLLAAAALGEVEDDEPPYGLDVLMSPPLGCWCHLAVVPDAGASTVSITVAPEPDRPLPSIDRVRDAWIEELNSLDWSELS